MDSTKSRERRGENPGHDNPAFSMDHEKVDMAGKADTARNMDVEEDMKAEEDDVDLSCGIWKFRTTALGKKFSNLYVFALCVGISTLFTSMINQVIHVQLISLERQFNIDNARAGLFDTASRIGFISTVLFAGHFAKKVHIPVVIALSGLAQGALLTIPAILQFIDPYELLIINSGNGDNSTNSTTGDNANYLCGVDVVSNNSTNTTKEPPTEKEANRLVYIIILVVQCLKGIAESFHSGFLPNLYIDDNLINKKRMSIFLGITSVFQDLSTPVGKEVNGILSEIPVDLKPTDIDPKDKRFVAAWWLAFLVLGIGTAVFSFPVLLFPRKLVSRKKQREALAKAVITFAGGQKKDDIIQDDVMEVEEDGKAGRSPSISVIPPTPDVSDADKSRELSRPDEERKSSLYSNGRRKSSTRRVSLFPPDTKMERKVSLTGDIVFEQPVTGDGGHEDSFRDLMRDFPQALKRAFTNPVFLLILVDVAIIAIPMSGTQMFKSMYMANEYNVPMSEVAYFSGLTTAIAGAGGTLLSSIISVRISTKVGYAYVIMGTYAFMTAVIPFYMIFGCGNEPVYGATGNSIGRPINASIQSHCGCTAERQLISCGDDGNNYYSPCHAGCSGLDGKSSRPQFSFVPIPLFAQLTNSTLSVCGISIVLFTDCTALANDTSRTLTPGLCSTECHGRFLLYVILDGFQWLVSAMSNIPRRLLVLRIMDPRDRGFGVSIFMFFYFLMSIPSPNVFGRVIDGTCLIWDDDVCNLYDRDEIRYVIAGIDIGVHGVLFLTCVLMVLTFKWQERRERKKASEANTEADSKLVSTKL